MKALAQWILSGRGQAVMVAAVSLVLALLITPLALVSAAVPALVTLRKGLREGLLVSLLGMAALGALGWLLFGQPLALAVTGALLWLPVCGLAELLRWSRSLRFAVEAAALLGLLMVAGQYLFLDDVTGYWKGVMADYLAQSVEPALMPAAEQKKLVDALAPWMAGGLGAAWFIQLALALFLARGAQARVENPGGFAREFRRLRLGTWLLILVPVTLVAGMLEKGPGLASQLSLVGLSAFFFQGVALVHGLVDRLQAGVGWLVGFYLMLVIGMPASFTLVSAAGFADGLVNFRARVRPRDADKKGDGE